MFEYLMPMLVMPTYENTLLDLSCKSAVARQIQYGKQIKVPWGISESGYNLRDAGANYQYRAFGVPGLGFKRGLAHDIVIAPYATVMALMVAPEEACKNLQALRKENAGGQIRPLRSAGLHRPRVPNGQTHALVRSFMAHHQGMSLLSLDLHFARPAHAAAISMPTRFSNPPNCCCTSACRAKPPCFIRMNSKPAGERESAPVNEATMRVFTDPNSRAAGSASAFQWPLSCDDHEYRRWLQPLERHRDDALARRCQRAIAGGHFFICVTWTAAPSGRPRINRPWKPRPVTRPFSARAARNFARACTKLTRTRRSPYRRRTTWKFAASRSPIIRTRIRTIEVTSYAEIVLNTAAADLAHPAFSNLFRSNANYPAAKRHSLFAPTARRAHEKLPWIAHLLLVHGNEIGTVSFETDRAKFIGRGGNLTSPAALEKLLRRCPTPKARCSIRLPPSAAPSGSNRRKAPPSPWFPASRPRAKKFSASLKNIRTRPSPTAVLNWPGPTA
jgi:cyclic beta-1,2-glucan synthetase